MSSLSRKLFSKIPFKLSTYSKLNYQFFVLSIKIATLALFFFFLSFLFSYNDFFENGVYINYTRSIVSDLDFNILNQFSHPADLWMITKNYHHPDFHFKTISSLLFLPEVLFQKIFYLSSEWRIYYYNLIGAFLFIFSAYKITSCLSETFNFSDKRIRNVMWLYFACTGGWLIFFHYPLSVDIINIFFYTLVFERFVGKQRLEYNFWYSVAFPCVFFIKTEMLIVSFFYFSLNWYSDRLTKKNIVESLSFGLYFLLFSIIRYSQIGSWDLFPMSSIVSMDVLFLLGWEKLFSLDGLLFYSPFYLLFPILFLHSLREKRNLNWRNLIFMSGPMIWISLSLLACPLRVINLFFDRHLVLFAVAFIYLGLSNYEILKKNSLKVGGVIVWGLCTKLYYFLSDRGASDWGALQRVDFYKYHHRINILVNFISQHIDFIFLGFFFIFVITWIFLRFKNYLVYVIAMVFIFSSSLTFLVSQKAINHDKRENRVICEGESCFLDDFVDVYSNAIRQYRAINDYESIKIIQNDFNMKYKKITRGLKLPNKYFEKCFTSGVRSSFWRIKKLYDPKSYTDEERDQNCFHDEVFDFSR